MDDKQADGAALARLKVEYRSAKHELFYDADYEGTLAKAAEYIAALEAALARVRAELAHRDEQPY